MHIKRRKGRPFVFSTRNPEEICNIITQIKSTQCARAAGITYVDLTTGGDLIPCVPASHITLGNLLKEDLEDLWVNDRLLNYIVAEMTLKGLAANAITTRSAVDVDTPPTSLTATG